MNDQFKRSNMSLNYGVINSSASDGYVFDENNFHSKRYSTQSPPKRQDNTGINEADEESLDGSHVMQMEKDTLKLRRDLQDALACRKNAESRILAYVWAQLSSRFGLLTIIVFSLFSSHASSRYRYHFTLCCLYVV